MGLSGSSTKSTYTPSPQQTQAAGTLTSAYNAAQPNTQAIDGQLSGLVPGLTSAAASANQGVGDAASYYQGELGGQYLSPSSNPYLAQMLQQNDAAIGDQVNGQFSAAGRTGSGANTYVLAKGIGEANNSLLSSNYTAERANQNQAAAGAGSLGSSSLASLLATAGQAANLPLQQAATYAGGIGSLKIDGSTTKTDTPSTMDQITKGIQLGSNIFSDRRLKRGVSLLSRMADGLGLYRYRYLWSDDEHVGVMADEVASLRPWALGPVVGGFRTVDYGAL